MNVAFVIDRSGSMAGRKIDMAREAAVHAIRLLGARDRFAVVAYDHDVTTVMESTAATHHEKARALALLPTIEARGNTDLDAGWLRGLELLGGTADIVRRVLLLSDGRANAGETNPDALARRAAEFRARGIATSTFGIGADFDEILMSRLAADGGGHFYYIEQPQQIPDVLASELGETLDVVAPGAEFVVSCGPGIGVAPLNGFAVAPRPGGIHVRLGDLIAGQEITLVLAVRCDARPAGATDAFVDCRLTDTRAALFPGAMRVDWRVVDAVANAAQPVSTRVLLAAAEQVAARERLAALAANRAGDFDTAARLLRQAAAFVREIGGHVPAIDRIAAGLDGEAEGFGQAMSALEIKRTYFQSVSASRHRDPDGKARRRA